jgi:hypothetical protein
MSVRGDRRQGESGVPDGAEGVRVVKPLQFDEQTPQTNGMRRLAAVSNALVGSEALWAGSCLPTPTRPAPCIITALWRR